MNHLAPQRKEIWKAVCSPELCQVCGHLFSSCKEKNALALHWKRNYDSTGGTQQAGELSALGEHSRPSTHADRVQLGLENWGQVHRGAGTRPCKVAEAGVRMAARRGRTMLGENGPKPRSCTRHRDHQGSALPWLGPHPGAALGSKWSRSDVSDSTTPWCIFLLPSSGDKLKGLVLWKS